MLIHPQTQSIVLNAVDPFSIRELIPKSRIIDHADYNIAVHHSVESTKILRNIGYDVPAPILSQYNWPGKHTPFAHQLVMAEFWTLNRRGFNLSEPGTCKTAAALWAADWLMLTKRVRKVLVLAPLSVVERVWQSDIFDTLMHRTAILVYGTRDQRMKALNTDVDFYILNHDGVSIAEINNCIKRNPEIDLVIMDEGDEFRNSDTQRYKALAKMLRPDMRLWWQTGTPCPNDPSDAWAQARLINPANVPQFFGAFKRRTMVQVTPFKWVPSADGYTAAFEAMQPAIRFKKADCLDLPPVVTEDRQCRLTKEQRDAFDDMRLAMKAEIAQRGGVGQLTAVNAADKINKLRQILCGAIKDPETDTYITMPHGPRLDVLLEAIRQASAKVYVVVPFKGIIQALAQEVSKHYSVGVLNGDVSPKARNKIISDFKTTPDPHVLLCHPKVTSHGLDFTEADTLIFYAPIYSNSQFQQVIERFNRPGQTRKMTIVRIGAHPLEWEIYRVVDTRKVTQENILSLYRVITG